MEYVSEEEKVTALQIILRQYDVKEGQNYHYYQEVVPRLNVLRLRVDFLSAKKCEVGTQ